MAINYSVTLIELVQEFCKRRGLPIPTTVVGNADPTVQQIWGLLNETVQTLVDRYEWQSRRARYEFYHAGAQLSYAKSVALVIREYSQLPDFRHMINRTLWDATNNIEVRGPLDPKEWEALLHLGPQAGTAFQYTVMEGALCIHPVPNPLTSVLFSFEWLSRFTVLTDGLGGEAWYKDASFSVYPSAILLMELKWRWNKDKGLPYAEDFRMAEEMIQNMIGREASPDIVMDDDGQWDARPAILVPSGNWKLP